MKRIIEETGSVLESLLGKIVTLFCVNYIYTGRLVAFDLENVEIAEPSIVYETGPFADPVWKDAQRLPKNLYIRLSAVESYGEIK